MTAKYFALFPMLSLFCLALQFLGYLRLPIEFDLFGRTINDIGSLTLFGFKTYSNMFFETLIALVLGVAAIVGLRSNKYGWRYIKKIYVLVLIMYMVFPPLW